MRITRSVKRWWQGRRQRHYTKSRLHLVLDISMLALVAAMAGLFVFVLFWRPDLIGIQVPFPGNGGQVEASFNRSDLPLDLELDLSEEGEGYALEIGYKNSFSRDLENIRLSLTLESGQRLQSFSLEGGRWKDQDGYLLTEKIVAGETGRLKLRLDVTGLAKQLKAKVTASYSSGGQSASESFFSNILLVPAMPSFSAAAHYYTSQGDQIGIGPVPPVVGIPTRYWILMDLSSSNGDLKEFAVAATLPTSVSFTSNRTLLAGQMAYNEGTRQIVWQVSEVEEGKGVSAGFEVEIVPSTDQVGRIPVLVEKIAYSAKDSVSGRKLSASFGSIDAQLENDELAKSDGKVRE